MGMGCNGKNVPIRNWSDGVVVESMHCLIEDPKFGSWYPCQPVYN